MANIKRAVTSGLTKPGTAIPDVPDAPAIGTATDVGTSRAFNNAAATVAFTAPATGGTATSYTATSSPGGFTGTGTSPITVTGLASATSYTFTVTGTNTTATGPASIASGAITATSVPATMTAPSASNVGTGRAYNNGAATVSFSAPATGGKAISSYTVTSSPGSFTASGAGSPLTVTGLASATGYTFTATATNANGTSTASPASESVTVTTVPQAPTIGTATAGATGSGQATVTFTAGATGGSAITNYTVTSSPGNITGTGSASPITVSGLTNGTAYTFTVTATNANGTSTASAASNSITVPPLVFAMAGFNNASGFGITATTSDGATWTTRSVPILSGNYLTQMTYGNGLFLTFGSSTRIYWTSGDNGVTWVSRDSGANGTFRDILFPVTAYQGGNWGTVNGFPGGFSVTNNPTGAWTQITPFTRQVNDGVSMQSATAGNGLWVAGLSLALYYQSNPFATSWTSRSTGLAANWRQMKYGNGVWVLGIDAGLGVTSNLDSTMSFKNFGKSVTNVAYLGGSSFLVSLTSQAVAYQSNDNGTSWTSRSLPSVFRSLNYNASFTYPYVASGNNYNWYYSSNGTSWTAVTSGAGDYYTGAFNV